MHTCIYITHTTAYKNGVIKIIIISTIQGSVYITYKCTVAKARCTLKLKSRDREIDSIVKLLRMSPHRGSE